MMKATRQYVPVRIDDHAPRDYAVRAAEAHEFDALLGAGILFWMTLVALAVISFAV